MEAAHPQIAGEVAVLKAHFNGTPGKGFTALDSLGKEGGRKSSAPLGEWFAPPALKYRRAPLPAFRGLEKALLCQGLADDTAELGDLARRYPFHGDPKMLLAESRKRPTPIANSLELVEQLTTERKTHRKPGLAINVLTLPSKE